MCKKVADVKISREPMQAIRRRLTFSLAVALTSACPPLIAAAQQPVVLVTEAEAAASEAAGGMLAPRSLAAPDAPRIELITPDISRPIAVSANIQIRFATTAPAEPKPETFRVLYGAFRLDVTQRLLASAVITKSGIQVRNAVLPVGSHQLALLLTDTLGRKVMHTISLGIKREIYEL